MDKTLLTLSNDEAKEIAQVVIGDIADQIPIIQQCMTLDKEESVSFLAILKSTSQDGNEQARELLSFMMGVNSQDLDLHVQEIIDEKFNCEE